MGALLPAILLPGQFHGRGRRFSVLESGIEQHPGHGHNGQGPQDGPGHAAAGNHQEVPPHYRQGRQDPLSRLGPVEEFQRQAITEHCHGKRYQRQQQDKQKKMAAYAGAAWDNVHNLVFTNAAGSFLSHRTVYDCFKRIVKSIGMETMRFHDLRHSYAVASIKNGDDIKTVQENLGHATAAFTLDVYAHATNQMKKASADRMEQDIQNLQGE